MKPSPSQLNNVELATNLQCFMFFGRNVIIFFSVGYEIEINETTLFSVV